MWGGHSLILCAPAPQHSAGWQTLFIFTNKSTVVYIKAILLAALINSAAVRGLRFLTNRSDPWASHLVNKDGPGE